MDDPPGSRLFVVCGKNAEEDVLLEAFRAFGNVTNLKLLRDKGVAYVKFDKASSAAAAIEMLHEVVLNDGKGPKVKVMLAESPNLRRSNQTWPPTRPESPVGQHTDPDNIPPRSRLFLVVPKNAEARLIEDAMNQYSNLTYCKTDLISSKGIVFCKFSKASSALYAMEHINESAMLAGYKVKCLLAEPKGKKNKGMEGALAGLDLAPMMAGLPGGLDGLGGFGDLMGAAGLAPGLGLIGAPDYNNTMRNALALLGIQGGAGTALGTPQNLMAQLQGINTGLMATPYGDMLSPTMYAGGPTYASLAGLTMPFNQGILGGTGQGLGLSSTASLSPDRATKPRLFVVVHKSVTVDQLTRLFSSYPGMEYCDLKREKTTGESKGYAFVSYNNYESAKQAIEQLNGMRFPHDSTHWIKVMFALPPTQPGTSTPREGLVETPRSPPHMPELNSHTSTLTSPLHNAQILGGTPGGFPGSLSGPQGSLSGLDTHNLPSSLFNLSDSIQNTQNAGYGIEGTTGSLSGPTGGPGDIGMLSVLSEGRHVLDGRIDTFTESLGSGFGAAGVTSPNRAPGALEGPSHLVHHSSMSQADAQELMHMQASYTTTGGHDSGSYESTNGPPSLQYEPLFGSPVGNINTGAAGGTPGGTLHGTPQNAASSITSPTVVASPRMHSIDAGQLPHGAVGTPLADDGTVLYTMLTRPLPQYTLEHVCKQAGDVESVQLYGPDQRYGAVKFSSASAAQAALAQLNGTQVLGETLQLSKVDLLGPLGHPGGTPQPSTSPVQHALGREQ